MATTTTPKVAVITGAGRRGGIGRAIARRLLLDGHSVVVSDLAAPMESHPDYQAAAPGELTQAVDGLRGLGPGGVAGCRRDLRRSADADALIAAAVGQFGRVDVLVNNAGIAIGLGPVVELTDQDWQVNLEVMASGVFYCSRAAARRMIDQGFGGRIVT